jgi:hypothetical protein
VGGVGMLSGCYMNYKTLTNDKIDSYFIVTKKQYSKDDTGKTVDIYNMLEVFSIKTGEIAYYNLDKVLGLYHIFNTSTGVNNGEEISQIYFTPNRHFVAFRIYGTDNLGKEYSNSLNRFKIIQLNLQSGKMKTILFPEYCEPISMPDEKTWLFIDYALERSERKVFYKLWDIDSGMSRIVYTINDITAPKALPHNFHAFYDLQYKVLVFLNHYLNDSHVYIYSEDKEELEISKYSPYWKMYMYDSKVIIGTKEREWYSYDLSKGEYKEIPFKSSVIYPVSENLYYFKDFMKPVFNGKGLDSTNYFRLGLYDIEKKQVVARWFDNRTSYDPYVPEYVPQINISEQYKINYLRE